MTNKAIIVFFLGISNFFLCAFATTEASTKTEGENILFVQTANQANLTLESSSQGMYLLTIDHVKPSVVWFSNRPLHTAGVVKLQKFISLWNPQQKQDHSFALTSPNAALVTQHIEQQNNASSTAPIFTLSAPHYSAQQHSLTYQAKLVPGSALPKIGRLEDIALLIDSLDIGEIGVHMAVG